MTTTSRPLSNSWLQRNDSRVSRFSRFLPVAARQFFFDIARPSRATPFSLSRQSTVKQLSRLRCALPNTRAKAAALSNRFSLQNRYGELPALMGCCSAAVKPAESLRRQFGAALRAAALQYEAASLRRHAGTKTMGACALDCAWLKCAFHCPVPKSETISRRPKSALFLEGRQGYADGFTVSIDASGGFSTDGIDCRVHVRKPY